MKNLFLGFIAAGMLLSACTQSAQTGDTSTTAAAPNAANAPVMKFDNITHDFGKVNQGDKVIYDFKFTNTGKSPLIITNAHASCGCTVPAWPHIPIKPDDTASIHVVFDSGAKKGLIDKQITVTANTVPADNRVHLIGEVIIKAK